MVPGPLQASVKTNLFIDSTKPTLGENFCVHMPLSMVYSKSLQIKVIAVTNGNEEWIGNAQISLAEFNPDDKSNFSKWYNIISLSNQDHKLIFNKEESSDESTIISSQASTLTRNENPYKINLKQNILIASDDEEDNESESCEDQLIDGTDLLNGCEDLENFGKFLFLLRRF